MMLGQRGSGTLKQTIPSKRKVSFVLISGERFRMSFADFWSLITDRYTLAYLGLSWALVSYLYPGDYRIGLTWWQVAAGVAAMEVVFILMLVLQFAAWIYILRGKEEIVIPATLTVFIAVAVLEYAKLIYADIFWGTDWVQPIPLGQAVATEYVFIFILEVIFSLFVISHTEIYKSTVINAHMKKRQETFSQSDQGFSMVSVLDITQPETSVLWSDEAVSNVSTGELTPAFQPQSSICPDPKSERATVQLSGETFDLRKLQMIRAEEHYIRVITSEGNHFLRHRMADAVSVLPDCFGTQVHRSLWLAYSVVDRYSRMPDGRLLIVLKDKREVHVPRARCKGVEALLSEAVPPFSAEDHAR